MKTRIDVADRPFAISPFFCCCSTRSSRFQLSLCRTSLAPSQAVIAPAPTPVEEEGVGREPVGKAAGKGFRASRMSLLCAAVAGAGT